MRRPGLGVSSLLVVVACGAPAAPTHDATKTAPTLDVAAKLPIASHALPPLDGVIPLVSVRGHQISVDAHVVDTDAEILRAGGLRRVDGVWAALKRDREEWLAAHPGAPLPGVALFAFDVTTPAVVVKSVVQTAAFAGYPNGQLSVRGVNGAAGHLNVDAIVPHSVKSTNPELDVLAVVVATSTLKLVWKKGTSEVSTDTISSLGELSIAVRRLWTANGVHRDKADRAVDQAVLFVANDVDYARLVAIIDAIAATTRELTTDAGVEQVAALNVTLSPATEVPTQTAIGGDGLAPDQIRSVVLAHQGSLRACYDAALAHDATLAGGVTVTWAIAPDGTVTHASIVSSTMGSASADACIVREVSSWHFASSTGPTNVAAYPFKFGVRAKQ